MKKIIFLLALMTSFQFSMARQDEMYSIVAGNPASNNMLKSPNPVNNGYTYNTSNPTKDYKYYMHKRKNNNWIGYWQFNGIWTLITNSI